MFASFGHPIILYKYVSMKCLENLVAYKLNTNRKAVNQRNLTGTVKAMEPFKCCIYAKTCS